MTPATYTRRIIRIMHIAFCARETTTCSSPFPPYLTLPAPVAFGLTLLLIVVGHSIAGAACNT